MMFDREIVKKFEKVFALVVIILIMKSAIELFIDYQNENQLLFNFQNILIIIGLFIVCIFAGMIHNIYLVIIYVAIKLASRSSYKKILDETDFNKNKNYYRDIVKNYGVSELNYIDKFKLEKKQSYTAKLLELENKKIIKVENGKIIKIHKPDNEIDEMFVDSIKNNKITMSLSEYEHLIENKALEQGLITRASIFEKFKDKKVIAIIAIVFIAMFVYVLLSPSVQNAENVQEMLLLGSIWLMIIGGLAFFFIIIFAIAYNFNNLAFNKYRRTDKGKEINLQLDGLKSFMDEFSNINNKESQHLVLWDEYLIYSVMFNINKKIQNEYSKYFD